MESDDPLPRRAMLTALLAAPAFVALSGTAASGEMGPADRIKGGRLLTAFFTRSGNTRVIAGTIHRALATDLFEIQAARPYPEDYEATVDLAREERDRRIEPALASKVPGFRRYEEIYLGFPIWGETVPPIIRSFLKAHDFSGKMIHPFITHGGYGRGNSLAVLKSHAPTARIGQAFVLEGDQEMRTIQQVNGWLQTIESGLK